MTSSPPSVRSRRAFTLLELIVTLVVLGLLAAVAIPTYLRLTSDTELRVAEANHAALARATVAHLRLDNTLDPE